ncbi:MFS transporter [Paenactinomyces guangxiensis]|uniref:MFS transporter n=1 Tax=Paenactinomyces guangxiensis TaxID=1490290 RepID=A0A7W1WTB3_9BACL|nr:MFS transporter [Paenactinomyces guangxiensis]MBA4495654.1 MFS transporter [Paenactinomyces guangxiensis]MBH8592642.1 MFS transporter [Paenactinomyces guangxiensis]
MPDLIRDKRLLTILTANIISAIGTGITGIAIPWLIINRSGGEQIYGYTILTITIALFFLSPYIGILIDRYPRKSFLLFCQVLGLTFVLPFAAWGYISGNFSTWQLIVMEIGAYLYYATHLPTLFAFSQEIFDPSQYKTVNSTMEIQSQFASMFSAGLSSILVSRIDFSLILLIDAITYIIGFILFLSIPYHRLQTGTEVRKASIWSNMKEGFSYLKKTPLLIVFLASSLMPFICVMVGNYLDPIYIIKTLHADASVLGISSAVYAIGAAFAGFTIIYMMKKLGSYQVVWICTAVYTIGILMIAMIPAVSLFIVLKFTLGWGNAGSKVARNTLMMELIPNSLIGRVNSFFNGLGMAERVILISFFTQLRKYAGPSTAYAIFGVLLIFALIGIFFSRQILSTSAKNVSTFKEVD